jgi:hypothetical protein
MDEKNKMDEEQSQEMSDNNEQPDLDWQRRTLCSDENCIGVIGPDGRCKVCGKKYEGSISEESIVENDISQDEAGVEAETEDDADPEVQSPADADWDNRLLCSDGNCIGVIGPDGRCKVCGKPYEG